MLKLQVFWFCFIKNNLHYVSLILVLFVQLVFTVYCPSFYVKMEVSSVEVGESFKLTWGFRFCGVGQNQCCLVCSMSKAWNIQFIVKLPHNLVPSSLVCDAENLLEVFCFYARQEQSVIKITLKPHMCINNFYTV